LLYIVATPIGNLADITYRAVEILKKVDLILAEDTRHSKKLLSHYDIDTQVISFHEYNEKEKSPYIIEQLQSKDIALISDAGTPLISDPGFNLVRDAQKHNIPISPIPGPSSVITAMSAAGLPSDNFCFAGFVPVKQSARQKFIATLNTNIHTTICFESPKRILNLISLMDKVFNTGRQISIAKELTKTFETIITGNTTKILHYLTECKEHQNGEFVVLVSGNKNAGEQEQLLQHILPILQQELSHSQAAKIAAKITGLNKKYCYEQLL
jgi:16S rRNA (cytidine1402-2'-O)-methyltransferase